MTWLEYKKQLQKQMNDYIDYLPLIKHNRSEFQTEIMTFKLLDEIQFLKLKIMHINRMTREKQNAYVELKKEKVKSKIYQE